ncbi:MAG: MBL fold metallo-hydrolase [Bacillota bacterium]|nr:MBL fold metallo-hydrolase [Bacillota bacterium]
MNIKRFIGGMLESNGYIISSRPDHDECYIIDPGYEPKKFIKYVNDKDLSVKGIILTHHHYDHVGGAERIKKALDCPILMHRCDVDRYGKDVDVYLEDGDVLVLGDDQAKAEKLVILHTPGHTKGGISIMSAASKVCFTGDTIFNVDLGRTDLDDGSDDELVSSIINVVDKWPNEITIYPGHGDPATMKTVRKINREFLDIVGD